MICGKAEISTSTIRRDYVRVSALLKRRIAGIHRRVSLSYLDQYVQEMTWRFNRRDTKIGARRNDLFGCVEDRLIHKALISCKG